MSINLSDTTPAAPTTPGVPAQYVNGLWQKDDASNVSVYVPLLNFADKETPTGTVDSANVTFTLSQTPSPSGSLILTRQGVVQIDGGTDFTLSAATITFTTAPITGDLLRAWYRY